jgi:ElaB/YqjD/DUF883 family membrane-anchored ribosome-binding protein
MPTTQDSYSRQEIKSLNDALNTLDQLARRGTSDLSKAIRKDFNTLKRNFEKMSPELKAAMSEVKEEGRKWWEESKEWMEESREQLMEKGRESIREVDQVARKHPWSFAGGAFALGAALAYLFCRKD